MSVRKRKWTTGQGVEKEAWVVDYVDSAGRRHLETLARKKDADAREAEVKVEVREGTHVAARDSATVSQAAELWIARCEKDGLERSTLDQYRQHVELHINPFLGPKRLTELVVAGARQFEEKLLATGRSHAMARKVLVSLGSLLADAQERGLVQRNVVRDMRRKRGGDGGREGRHKGRLVVGVDIPTPQEVKAIVGALEGNWRPLLLTAIFTGLRASELRGLRWEDVDFEKHEITVRRRADRFNALGSPKSKSSHREVPMPPLVSTTLREWRLACPQGKYDLVFPNGSGNVESHANIINRGLLPALIAAGVTATERDDNRPVPTLASHPVAKYTGLHALRHFYASWCINRREDGGLGLPPKTVQDRLGHSSILMTMDVYGHLFPKVDHIDEMAAAEMALLG